MIYILIGLVLVLTLLYFWLQGHWFARIVMFLPLACAGFAAGLATVGLGIYGGAGMPLTPELLGGAIGAAVAWPIASLPIYYYRREYRRARGDQLIGWPQRVLR